jgi:ABC-2 type transport system permease protein
MSAPLPSATRETAHSPARTATFGRALRAEWIKLSTLRITWAGVAIAFVGVLLLGIAAAAGAEYARDIDHGLELNRQIYAMSTGLSTAVLVFLLLGVASIGNEHTSGLIRVTLTVMPRRGLAFGARALVLVMLAFATIIVSLLTTIAVTTLILGDKGYTLTYTSPIMVTAFLGAAFSVPMVALIGLAIGSLMRSTAGGMLVALLVVLGIPFALQALGLALDAAWPTNLARLLPADQPWTMASVPDLAALDLPQFDGKGYLQPFTWQAWAILSTWTALLTCIACAAFIRRRA